MRKKILGIFVCMLVCATCLPVTSTISIEKKSNAGITPFWNPEHTLSIYMHKVYVYESGDSGTNEPGEYYFNIFLFPAFQHFKTQIYEVDDEHPEDPYNFDRIATFKLKFTPQILLIFAIENDKRDDLNQNEFMGWTRIKFNPPKGNYSLEHPYGEPIIKWYEAQWFTAEIGLSFHYT